ncbi:MAG: LysR substrate-binding domain-containing protein [Enterobacteriaceae bacterium]
MTNINNRPIVNLELDLLRTFVAVADRNTFAAAAASVCRTQSAVSQQMQRLEQLVGKELFARHGRNKALTTQGIQMLGYARKMLHLNDEACMSMMHDDVEGTLRIGSPDDTANTILPSLISRFAKAYPSLSIEVQVKHGQRLMDLLQGSEVDMIISSSENLDFPCLTLRTSPSLWYCANGYQLQLDEPLPLVVMDESLVYRNMMIKALDNAGIRWRIAYTANTLSSARAAVEAGVGIIARSVELWDDNLRVLSESEGLPRLPDVHYYLYIGHGVHKAAKVMFESLLDSHPQQQKLIQSSEQVIDQALKHIMDKNPVDELVK